MRQSVSYRAVSQSVSQSVSQPVMGGQTVRQEEGKEAQGPLPAGYQGPELVLEGQYTLLESRINCSVLG